jgi:hypothetical protein
VAITCFAGTDAAFDRDPAESVAADVRALCHRAIVVKGDTGKAETATAPVTATAGQLRRSRERPFHPPRQTPKRHSG